MPASEGPDPEPSRQPRIAGVAFRCPSLLGPGDRPVGSKGATGFVALNYRDLVLVTTGLNYVADGISAGTSLSLGLRFGSYLGPPVLLATLVGAAVVAGGGS